MDNNNIPTIEDYTGDAEEARRIQKLLERDLMDSSKELGIIVSEDIEDMKTNIKDAMIQKIDAIQKDLDDCIFNLSSCVNTACSDAEEILIRTTRAHNAALEEIQKG